MRQAREWAEELNASSYCHHRGHVVLDRLNARKTGSKPSRGKETLLRNKGRKDRKK